MVGVRTVIEGPWRRYFVICAESIVRHWWNPFLRKGYRHCYLLIWEGAVWLHVDPTMDRSRVVILELFDGFEHPAAWIEDDTARVFEAWPEPDSERLRCPWIFGPVTCVELVKAYLGIRNPFIWTPWQLAQCLRKRRRQRESQETESIARGESARRRAGERTGTPGGNPEREAAPDHPRTDLEPDLAAATPAAPAGRPDAGTTAALQHEP